MSFVRQETEHWRQDVPGAQWFRADLHVHTLDDHHGGNVKWPAGLNGNPTDPGMLKRYARAFLQGVVRSRIKVLGLTPHSTRTGSSPETSAVWHIVDAWNSDNDDDGTPFREKIFAVFPGFEPNVNDGGKGVHLLFLFDPEIGRDRYLRLFDALMDARDPWEGGRSLRLTQREAKGIFKTVDDRRGESTDPNQAWDYLVIAPHFQNHHGLLHEVQSQVLETFPCERIAAYELGDEKLPRDFDRSTKPGNFLLPFMADHNQPFIHSSDAYRIPEGEAPPDPGCVGHRYTFVKMASPRVESLRQALIASDSRLRIAHARNDQGDLVEIDDPPDVTTSKRPWLQSLTLRGQGSFFGWEEGEDQRTLFARMSPDLTCIIGGSMTGKSTLLDGLRKHVSYEPPEDDSLKKEMEGRAGAFLLGSPEITLETPGRDKNAPFSERWPAVFFTQGELRQIARNDGAVEDILARLVPVETDGIFSRRDKLSTLDVDLEHLGKSLSKLDDQVAETEQAHERAKMAKEQLKAFSEAGVDELEEVSRTRVRWKGARQRGESLLAELEQVREGLASLDTPEVDAYTVAALNAADLEAPDAETSGGKERIEGHLDAAMEETRAWIGRARRTEEALDAHEAGLRTRVDRELAEQGLDAAKLMEFQALSKQASLLASYEAALTEAQERYDRADSAFKAQRASRADLVNEQRQAFARVVETVHVEFDDRIRVRLVESGSWKPLDTFLRGFKQRGITQWWNSADETEWPRPEQLSDALARNTLNEVGMSAAVQESFQEVMTRTRRRELEALRCPDIYSLELRVGDGEYRRLADLSGGQRVSVLLSLLLETSDERPLVIDQPEDELDNSFLFDTVLPVLKRLKGRRQVIVATHNANIVVNGDADQVILLEATAHKGWVARTGAIEQPEIRDAIVRTVDGGGDAFRLRKLKYGF